MHVFRDLSVSRAHTVIIRRSTLVEGDQGVHVFCELILSRAPVTTLHCSTFVVHGAMILRTYGSSGGLHSRVCLLAMLRHWR